VRGRKLRRALIERNQGVLERLAEEGATFVSLAQMRSAGRFVACPLGSWTSLILRRHGLGYGYAERVSGGWRLSFG
jgi:hypothetical protein